MKVNVARPVIGLTGEPILNEESRPLLLRDLFIAGLDLAPKGLTPTETVERFKAQRSVATEDEPDISVELLGIIKEGLAKRYPPRIAGPAILMIEGG